MQVSRIARTHLAYQFIIITLAVLCVGYYELLLDKKSIFILALVPMFFYQLVTLSCYKELLPVAHWLNLIDILCSESDSKTGNKADHSTGLVGKAESQELKEHPVENLNRTETKNTVTIPLTNSNNENCFPKPRTYKFRNWQSKCFTTGIDTEPSSSNLNAFKVNKTKKCHKFTLSNNENQFKDSELTKIYFFPYRQKRPEQWMDSKDNERPCKIRSRIPNIGESEEMDNQPTSSTPAVTTPQKPDEVPVAHDTEFRKSYSFPFRYKKSEPRKELDETTEVSSTPSMPYWQSVEYSVKAKKNTRKRRSASISNLTNEQFDLTNDIVNNADHREFSQSMEISDTSHPVYSDSKRSSSKVTNANFNKLKMGIINYFSRIKKENSKTNFDRKETDFKESLSTPFFQSKENLQSLKAQDNRISPKPRGKGKENSNIYSGYVPFEKFSFEKDVRSRLVELSAN